MTINIKTLQCWHVNKPIHPVRKIKLLTPTLEQSRVEQSRAGGGTEPASQPASQSYLSDSNFLSPRQVLPCQSWDIWVSSLWIMDVEPRLKEFNCNLIDYNVCLPILVMHWYNNNTTDNNQVNNDLIWFWSGWEKLAPRSIPEIFDKW